MVSLTKPLSSPLRFLVNLIRCLMQIDLLALTEEEASSCQVTGSKAVWHLQKTNNPVLAFFFGPKHSLQHGMQSEHTNQS